jgi:hypothetical protein
MSSGPDIGQAMAQISFLSSCAVDFETAAGPVGSGLAASYGQQGRALRVQIQEIYKSIANTIGDWNKSQLAEQCQTLAAEQSQQCQVDNQLATQAAAVAKAEQGEHSGIGPQVLEIVGGEDFPQGREIVLDIGGGLFTGVFSGTSFTISKRRHPDNEKQFQQTLLDSFSGGSTGGGSTGGGSVCPTEAASNCATPESCTKTKLSMNTPNWVTGTLRARESWVIHCPPVNMSGNRTSTVDGETSVTGADGNPILVNNISPKAMEPIQFWADPGTNVSISGYDPMCYVACIIPCRVLTVKAFRQIPGNARRLVSVPGSYYTISTQRLTTDLTITYVVLNKDLTKYSEEGWESGIYVSVASSVGPNIADILVYLITTYTSMSYNHTDFSLVKTQLAKFPANFPVLDRKNSLDILQELAYQARCALWSDDGIFRIKYLAVKPAAVDTITLEDLDFDTGFTVSSDSTESLLTKYKCKWHLTWAQPDPLGKHVPGGEYNLTLRNNVKKYGTKEQSYDFYIYNQPDIVQKIATFWLIRKSTMWKRISFSTFLPKLPLEIFDAVYLDFGSNGPSSGPTLAVIISVKYNSDKKTIDFICEVPIRFGEMSTYDLYWPSDMDIHYPIPADIASGNAGGDGLGKSMTTTSLPVGYLPTTDNNNNLFVGGINIGYIGRAELGDRSPSDLGFVARPVQVELTSPGIAGSSPRTSTVFSPLAVINIVVPAKPKPLGIVPMPQGHGEAINLDDAILFDPDTRKYAAFRQFFKCITASRELLADTEALWTDPEDSTKGLKFDFKKDTERDQLGAGTAFLQDEL